MARIHGCQPHPIDHSNRHHPTANPIRERELHRERPCTIRAPPPLCGAGTGRLAVRLGIVGRGTGTGLYVDRVHGDEEQSHRLSMEFVEAASPPRGLSAAGTGVVGFPLLQAYPEAASLPTQFGQLPLHLAVECSASPEVVNLLLVSYFQGVACTDQSGRTPLQILQDAEVTEIRAHQTVLESLQRANVSWRCIQSAHERQMRFLEQQHTNGLTEIRNQHQQDLKVEQDHAEKLLERVVLLDDALKVAKQDQAAAVAHAHKLEERDGVWQERITQLEKAMAEMTTLNDQEAQHVAALREVIQNKEKQIQGLQAEMASLRRSLQKVAVFANMNMLNQLNDTQSKIQNMLDSFVDLHETMELHRNELTGVAQTIGLSDDEVHGVVRRTECETNSTNTETVDKRDRNIEEEVDDEKAMQSAAMAAASVLIP